MSVGERECSRCGDDVNYLNSQDECLGCEEERERRQRKPEIDGPGSCEMCRGSGMVAVGPWGARPPRKQCPQCGGTGWEPDD